jgi:HSP20 family protein
MSHPRNRSPEILQMNSNNKQDSREEVRTPKIDLYEEDRQYFLRISIPGVKKENLHIYFVNQDLLEIKGTVLSYAPEQTINKIAEEIYQGHFLRRIRVPKDIDKQNLKFNYNRGILEVFLPKAPKKDV